MDNGLNRLPEESELQYLSRITLGKNLYDLDYVEWGEFVLGEVSYSSENLRKAYYVIEKIFKNPNVSREIALIKKEEDLTSDEVILKKIELATRELEKEKFKYRDEKREYYNFLRVEARWENLRDLVLEEIKKMNAEKPLLPNLKCKESGTAIASLLLSDFHIGIEVDTFLNEYDIDIAKTYLKKLELQVIKYCKVHNISKLNLEILGDLVSGIIHQTVRLYQQENVIQQTIIASEMLAEFICNLAKELSNIDIYFSVGNHSRVTANYKESLSEENFEYIILWYLKGRLSNIESVRFIDNVYTDEIIVYPIFDKKIASIHGHKDKPEKVLATLSKMLGTQFDEIHMGHYHNVSYKDGVIINGAFCGVDQHSQDLRFSVTPSQVMKVYFDDGSSCLYNLVLNN